ncbi:dethiobiotin synthase [Rothia sp. P5764]|uniref:dethiobiotin synthase n=1 Tax=Rothia sp. P5764 TaxID=3402654 RepID=UPI003ACDCD67
MSSSAVIYHIVGTDTDVGKTLATACLASALEQAGKRVAIYKPAQTGVGPGQPGDADFAAYLSGARAFEGSRASRPLAPVAAARLDGFTLPSLQKHAERIGLLSADYDAVIVEGSGGVTVDMAEGEPGSTYRPYNHAHLIELLTQSGHRAKTFLVARSGLGTLNHCQLTVSYLSQLNLPVEGLIIGSWPAQPSYIEESNVCALTEMGYRVLARIPAGLGRGFSAGESHDLLWPDAALEDFRVTAQQLFGALVA